MRFVLAAAEQGTIVRAAARAGVSQATIGAAINHLEEVFRVRIFVRLPGRGLKLTASGEELIQRIRKLITDIDKFESFAAQMSRHLSGPISVACFFPAASYVMPRLIERLSRKYPAISIELYEGDVYEVLQKLLDGNADIGLTYNLVSHDRMTFEPVLAVPLFVVVPRKSHLANQQSISLFDLATEPFIMLDLPGSRDWFLQVFRHLGLTPNVRFRTRSTDMVRSLVANGQGYSLLGFKSFAERSHDGETLNYIPIRDPIPTAMFGLAYTENSLKKRAVEVFASEARDMLAHFAKDSRSGQQ